MVVDVMCVVTATAVVLALLPGAPELLSAPTGSNTLMRQHTTSNNQLIMETRLEHCMHRVKGRPS
eukprot:m.37242 g.37242  ORF g.37242 m.37242 type:complete len:65 (-) comp13029_c0_seq1:102-296(-)